ncbi:DUF998 domain-containing protein [Nocardiopsis changdeensis]|uniref:DUF998 domain-containing protein n=1 Tax=Nocardiopsis changdeensis TaxID=2831969 RepID=A0ABX8BPD2_9ACTN|nr:MULTISPECIES: DUF998 domain-containing protein [Nocardiopsis]QUX23538.1 DUF998 domain-containing protein [Nocardiopsis changdeensis]QYX39482.1 DUF998 domain-containing protein [Nocardiopsis sp. MT53]
MSYSGHWHWDYRDGRVAAVAAAIVYSLWALEVMLPGGSLGQGASADPESGFGRFLDSAHRAGSILVVLAAALGLTLGARRTGFWLTASWWSMAVFGAASFVASLLPGRCVVSTDVACASEALAEGVGGATAAQPVLATVTIVAALAGAVTLAVDRRRAADPAWVWAAAVAALQALAAVAVLVLAVRVSGGDGDPGVALGLLERAHLVTVALWLLTAGILSGPWKRSGVRRPTPVSR